MHEERTNERKRGIRNRSDVNITCSGWSEKKGVWPFWIMQTCSRLCNIRVRFHLYSGKNLSHKSFVVTSVSVLHNNFSTLNSKAFSFSGWGVMWLSCQLGVMGSVFLKRSFALQTSLKRTHQLNQTACLIIHMLSIRNGEYAWNCTHIQSFCLTFMCIFFSVQVFPSISAKHEDTSIKNWKCITVLINVQLIYQ